MKRIHQIISSLFFIAALLPAAAHAGSVDLPNSFAAGTPAVAAEVNANFNAVKTSVDDNDTRITDHDTRVGQLETQVATLQAQLAALQGYIDALQAAVTLQTDAQGHPAVVFSGVNVHINNGWASTDTVNGRGNLIIGYNETRTSGTSVCSDGDHDNLTDCVNNGGVWQPSHKSGSHNIVLGPNHNYSRYGGLVAGYQNTINGISAVVSGGEGNMASAPSSSVSGGVLNTALGFASSVSGGANNTASGPNSSVSGGYTNNASGSLSSISGGSNNTAGGQYSSVSGGIANTASGFVSSISGGNTNIAGGARSSVSGGNSRTASNTDDWVAGSLLQDN